MPLYVLNARYLISRWDKKKQVMYEPSMRLLLSLALGLFLVWGLSDRSGSVTLSHLKHRIPEQQGCPETVSLPRPKAPNSAGQFCLLILIYSLTVHLISVAVAQM